LFPVDVDGRVRMGGKEGRRDRRFIRGIVGGGGVRDGVWGVGEGVKVVARCSK
jgi:hypothetical protein